LRILAIAIFSAPARAAPEASLSRGLILIMAAATGIAVANIYYSQPMLGLMERDLRGPGAAMIPTVTQLGYAIGLFLLVPLGDVMERRRLIVLQFMALAGALVAVALAPSVGLVLAASFLVGVATTVAQQIVPFAAHLAAPEKRGTAVGTVMSGLLAGILLSRTLAGFVGAQAGWRAMFWVSVPLALAAGLVLAVSLPRSRPQVSIGYGELVRSMVQLWRALPELRLAGMTQALLFASFSAFWTILALHLQEPAFGLGSAAAGLFGVLGLSGIAAAPIAGRIADRAGPHGPVLLAAVLVLVSWGVFGLWLGLAGLVVGVVLMDMAVQGALVSNQHIIYALRPEARSRINTLFMGTMFFGGSLGSSVAVYAWKTGGWGRVSLLGAVLGAGAVVLQWVGRLRRGK
jgi:predicted MFS family arabinose efflux permease